MSNAPVGFRFNPTEEELVRYYLANRVAGYSQDLWRGLINEYDMYAEEPWELWGRFYRPNLGGNNLVEAKSDKYIYLFTTLKKVASSGDGKRVNRRVGTSGGTWHGQNTKNCKGESGFSWCERRFSYKNDKHKEQDGGWLMMEFCFHEDDSLVLCRIGKKSLRVDDDEDHHRHASVSTRGRSPGTGITLQAYSPVVVYNVKDDNFTVSGTKAKRTRTEGMLSGSGISIVDGEQVQHHHGGVGCGFGNQASVNMRIPYHHGIDQEDQGGNSLFNPTRIDEVGGMNMGIPYHHGPDFGASNQRIDGSFPTTWMEGMNDKIQMEVEASCTLSGHVLIESGLLEPTSIGVHEDLNHEENGDGSTNGTMDPNTRRMQEEEEVEADMGINALDDLNGNSAVEGDTRIGGNIEEPDHEDNVDLFDLDNINIVVGDIDELEEAMMATFPENYDNINGGPITRMQQEEEEDMVTNGLDDLNGFGPAFNASDSNYRDDNNCDHDINLPGLTNWDDLDQCQINSLDEWTLELQRGDQSPIQRIHADHLPARDDD